MTHAAPSRHPPTLATLITRVQAYCDFFNTDTSAESLALLIEDKCLEGAICSGAVVDGKWHPALTMEQYYEAVFGVGMDGRVVKKRKSKAAA